MAESSSTATALPSGQGRMEWQIAAILVAATVALPIFVSMVVVKVCAGYRERQGRDGAQDNAESAIHRATRARSDGALVRFTTADLKDGPEEAADQRIRDLARVLAPELPHHVPD